MCGGEASKSRLPSISQYMLYVPPVGINRKKLLQMCWVEQLSWFAAIDETLTEESKGAGSGPSVSVLKGFWLLAQGSCPKMPDVLHSQGLQCKHCSVPQGTVVHLLFKKSRRRRVTEQAVGCLSTEHSGSAWVTGCTIKVWKATNSIVYSIEKQLAFHTGRWRCVSVSSMALANMPQNAEFQPYCCQNKQTKVE